MREEVGEDRGSSGQGGGGGGEERVFLTELQVSAFAASVGALGRDVETSFL